MLRIRCREREGNLKHLYIIIDGCYEITMDTGEKESVHLSNVKDNEIEFIKNEEK